MNIIKNLIYIIKEHIFNRMAYGNKLMTCAILLEEEKRSDNY